MNHVLRVLHFRTIQRLGVSALLAGAIVAAVTSPAFADTTFGTLWYNGGTIHTVVNPGEIPNGGTDAFYKVTNPAARQLGGITSTAPGAADYHGGSWAVSEVTFKSGVTPYLLTSQAAVLAAQTAGDVTVTRMPSLDFRCPVQP